MGENTRLSILGDILRVGPSGLPFGFASIGDVILCAGIAVLCFRLVKQPRIEQTDTEQNKPKARGSASACSGAEK